MEFNLLQFVKAPMVISVVVVIQAIKTVLVNRGIATKSDVWVLVVLVSGVLMAFIAQGIDGFKSFNVFVFLSSVFVYAAAAAFVYKLYRVGGRSVDEFFKKERDTDGK